MDEIHPQLKFFVEQISFQHRELKSDIRAELTLLRQDLAAEFKHTEERIQALTDETDRRLGLMEEQVLTLQKFKWMSLGVTSLVIILIEAILGRG